MKRLVLLATLLSSLAACATTTAQHSSMAGITGHGRTIGTQGSTTARETDAIALNARETDADGRATRGIPTPQPVREPSMSAHSIPVPQPPIPGPNLRGSFAARYP
jgi:hypothetical protein